MYNCTDAYTVWLSIVFEVLINHNLIPNLQEDSTKVNNRPKIHHSLGKLFFKDHTFGSENARLLVSFKLSGIFSVFYTLVDLLMSIRMYKKEAQCVSTMAAYGLLLTNFFFSVGRGIW